MILDWPVEYDERREKQKKGERPAPGCDDSRQSERVDAIVAPLTPTVRLLVLVLFVLFVLLLLLLLRLLFLSDSTLSSHIFLLFWTTSDLVNEGLEVWS